MQVRPITVDRPVVNSWTIIISIGIFQVVLALTDQLNAGATSPSCAGFYDTLGASDDGTALVLGEAIFEQLAHKYRDDVGFGALRSKLKAAEFLAGQMIFQLNKARAEKAALVANELFEKISPTPETELLLVAPARSFYETSTGIFSKPVAIAGLAAEEKEFLARYYDHKLRLLTTNVAAAGQALVVAEPTFDGAHDYVLVLPLLHTSDNQQVNVNVLPCWMLKPEHLQVFSDSCLLHFGLPFQAMMLAKHEVKTQDELFSELRFYCTAARKCQAKHTRLAIDCLEKALGCVPETDTDTHVGLRFEIIQVCLDSGNYALAAGRAHKVFESFPRHKQAGDAIWLYFYSLSRDNNTEGILSEIDSALADDRCRLHKPKLVYIKWWALRRNPDQAAAVATVEYKLLRDYGDDPMVAPILLSQATDQLARQGYGAARQALSELAAKFPNTEAAGQAVKMLEKLRTTGEVR